MVVRGRYRTRLNETGTETERLPAGAADAGADDPAKDVSGRGARMDLARDLLATTPISTNYGHATGQATD